MFGQFHGLPVHALVLHVAVLLAPLAAFAGVALLVPKWRRYLRWPFVAAAAAGLAAVFVAIKSGENLQRALGDQLTGPGNLSGALIAQHQELAQKLLIALIVLLVLAIVSAVLQRRMASRWIGVAVVSCVTIVAGFVLVLTYQTGEAGAKARWNPDGSFDYSAGK